MTSKRDRANVARKGSPDKDDRKVIGGRATLAERILIDTARARLQEDRATFVVKAAVDRARQVLAAA